MYRAEIEHDACVLPDQSAQALKIFSELRIIGQAKAEEELVLVVEVDIHSSVKCVSVLEQFWRSRKVAEKRVTGRRREKTQ